MTYYFKLEGETPAKKNSRIINTKTGRSFPSKKYSDWHKSAVLEIKTQNIFNLKEPINRPVRVDLIFTHGDNRRRDSDNGCSSILDTLVDAGVLLDDCYTIVEEINIKNLYEKNNASCIIKIMTL